MPLDKKLSKTVIDKAGDFIMKFANDHGSGRTVELPNSRSQRRRHSDDHRRAPSGYPRPPRGHSSKGNSYQQPSSYEEGDYYGGGSYDRPPYYGEEHPAGNEPFYGPPGNSSHSRPPNYDGEHYMGNGPYQRPPGSGSHSKPSRYNGAHNNSGGNSYQRPPGSGKPRPSGSGSHSQKPSGHGGGGNTSMKKMQDKVMAKMQDPVTQAKVERIMREQLKKSLKRFAAEL